MSKARHKELDRMRKRFRGDLAKAFQTMDRQQSKLIELERVRGERLSKASSKVRKLSKENRELRAKIEELEEQLNDE